MKNLKAFLSIQKNVYILVMVGVTILLIFVLILIGTSNTKSKQTSNSETSSQSSSESSSISSSSTSSKIKSVWIQSIDGWTNEGKETNCVSPKFSSPVNTSLVKAVLYPGQVRSEFKPHGGFIFNTKNNTVEVKAPFDAVLVEGSRYIENGETQYLFRFISDCGIMYAFDHILTPSQKLLEIANTFPEAKLNDSRTTLVTPQVRFSEGDILAMEVGFKKTKNYSMDFGLYDLNTKNEASNDPTFVSKYVKSYLASTALCWLDNLNEPDKTTLKALPGGDSKAKKTSFYCK